MKIAICARWLTLAALALVLAGCSRERSPSAGADPAASVNRLRSDVTFLASDALEGRGTPSRGLDLAALYLETQLQAAGVAPAVSGSYRQGYRVGNYTPAEARVVVRINGRTVNPGDYIFVNSGRDPAKGPLALPSVEVGYGIVSEERNVDELAGRDLLGKAVVARKGAPWPLHPGAFFGPDRAVGKFTAAAARGAELFVYLTEELDDASDAESMLVRHMKGVPVSFLRPEIPHASTFGPVLLLKPKAYAAGGAGKIEVSISASVREARASNVVGKIEGTDPALRNEWVVVSAHYDHLGSPPVPAGQDGIWNGADDNASGTAAVLELARQVARAPGRRSLLVLLVSGEECGLLGSAYYAADPVAPMKQVVAQINLDMVGRPEGNKVEALAHVSRALFDQAVGAGKRHGIEVIADRHPEWRALYLTDTYAFARAEVPCIHFFTSLHADYHQPSDTAGKIHYAEMARIVAAAAEMARAYLDGAPRPSFERPKWFVTP